MSTTTTASVTQTTSDTPPPNMVPADYVDPQELSAYRLRRWFFVLGTTLLSMIAMMLVAWFRTGSIAEHAEDGFSGIAETVIVAYLGVSAIDRSSILQSMGSRIKNGPIGNVLSNPPPPQ